MIVALRVNDHECAPSRLFPSDGFTLLELIATIAIIAVLSVMVIPLVSKIYDASKRSQCSNNMRQLAAGLFAYAADNNQQLPPVSSVWPPLPNQKTMWGYAIWTYVGYKEEDFQSPLNDLGMTDSVKKANVFRCPSNQTKAVKVPSTSQIVHPARLSYGLNSRPTGTPQGAENSLFYTTPIPLTRIQKPSSTAMVMETSYCLGSMVGYFSYYGLIPHSEGSNVCFFDGHVEYRKIGDIPRPDVGAGRSFWNGN